MFLCKFVDWLLCWPGWAGWLAEPNDKSSAFYVLFFFGICLRIPFNKPGLFRRSPGMFRPSCEEEEALLLVNIQLNTDILSAGYH